MDDKLPNQPALVVRTPQKTAQTRERLIKKYPTWKDQQKMQWVMDRCLGASKMPQESIQDLGVIYKGRSAVGQC